MAACQVAWKTLPRGCDCDMCLLTCTLSAPVVSSTRCTPCQFCLAHPPSPGTTSYRASTGIFAEKKKNEMEVSLLAVKWVQTAESPAGPGSVTCGAAWTSGGGELHRERCKGTVSPPSRTAVHPISLQVPVCVQRVPACAREAKDPTELFSLSPFQKNGPIHSCNR